MADPMPFNSRLSSVRFTSLIGVPVKKDSITSVGTLVCVDGTITMKSPGVRPVRR